MDRKLFSPNLLKLLQLLQTVFLVAVLIIASLVFVGWIFRSDFLAAINSSYRGMKFNVSIAFTLLSIGLLIPRGYSKVSQLMAIFVIVLGMVTLSQYLFGWHLGIDELFVPDTESLENLPPGRMSPITAVLFCILGLSLFLNEQYRLQSQILSLLTSFLGLLSVAGYLYGVTELYQIANFAAIALPTAVSFVLMGLSIFLLEPTEGLAAWIFVNRAGGHMAQRLIVLLIILPLSIGWFRLKGEELGFYDTAFGLAIFALSNIFIVTSLLFWTARSLNSVDEKRVKAVNELEIAYAELELKVQERTADLQKTKENLEAEIQERKALEAERDSFFDLSIDMLAIAGFDGYFKSVNTAFERILGFRKKQLLEHPFLDFVYPDDVELLRTELNNLAQGQSTLDFEIRFVCADGSSKWTSWTAQPMLEESLIYVVGRDVTRQKQAEELLQSKMDAEHEFQNYLEALQKIVIELTSINQLDAFYKRVVEFGVEEFGFERFGLLLYDNQGDLAIGTYGTDPSGNIIDERQLRFQPTELTSILARTFHAEERFVIDDNAELFHDFKSIGKGQNAVAILWNGQDKLGWLAIDNAIHHQLISKAQLEILALYALSIASLLTQKQAQKALEESELRYRSVVSTLSEGIVLQDKDGKILTSNTAAESILGLTRNQMMGRDSLDPLWRPIHEDGSPFPGETHPAMMSLKTGKSYIDVMMGVHKPDNSLTWILINSKPMFHEEKEPYAVVASFRDISQLRQAQEQAFQAAIEKERAQVLIQFIQNSSHEFRTPLSIMRTNLYILNKTEDAERRQAKSKSIEEQISRINHLVDMLVIIASLDSAVEFSFSRQDLNRLVQDECQLLQTAFMSKDLKLSFELAEKLPQATVDLNQFAQAFRQIIDNAIRFSDTGGQIIISTSFDTQDIKISIQDKGCGIAPEALPRIFERFYREDQAHSTPGFGLGLAIAKMIIERHGGEIVVSSTLGVGSNFQIILPFM